MSYAWPRTMPWMPAIEKIIRQYGDEIVFFAFLFALQVIVAGIAASGGITETQRAVNLAYPAMGLVAFLFWLKSGSNVRVPWLGLKITQRFWRDLELGVSLACMYYGVAVLFPWLCGMMVVEVNPRGAQFSLSGWHPMWNGVLVALASMGILFVNKLCGEEMAFRGILFWGSWKKSGLVSGIVLNGLMFGVWHVPYLFALREMGGSRLLMQVIWFSLGAIPVCLLFAATKNLYAISLYHAIVNLKEQVLLRSGDAPVCEWLDHTFFKFYVINHYPVVAFQFCALLGQIGFAIWLFYRIGAAKGESASSRKAMSGP